MNLDKLKESARKFEQGGQWRQAIDVYKKALKEFEEAGEGVPDPSLYNRVGDLEMKDNDASSAIRAYEQAADLYTEQGFFNNAIALCGKILRVNPGRTPTYLRLAQLNARKNFVGEAKKNLLEYIERMDALQHREEALQAVKIFADQFSANPDIRLMLVELLRASSRMKEAREQLGKLATELEARGDATGARRTRERLESIEDEAPSERLDEVRSAPSDLIFIDTGVPKPGEPVEPVARIIIEPTPEALGILEPPPTIEGFESLEPDPPELEARTDDGVRDFIINSATFDELSADGVGADVDPIEVDVVPELDLGDEAIGAELDPIERAGELDITTIDPDAPYEAIEPVELESEPGGGPPAPDLVFLQVPDPAETETEGAVEDAALMLRDRGRLLLEIGDRVEGVRTLETALERLASESRFDASLQIADDLIRLEPEAVFRYQKRVEVAYRAGQRPELITSYLGLADALLRGGGLEHAITVYRRVLDHDAGNPQARAALALLVPPEHAPAPPVAAPPPPPAPPNNFIDLGALILDEPTTRDTRMRVDQARPIEDEDEAFHEALAQFKRGIEENLDAEDFQAHYDLGVAFKEMGLLDEAIAQFQKALRSPEGRLKTSEQLGISFYEKGRFAIAEAVLRRAVENLPGPDDEKIGLIYWLARSLEAQQRRPEALGFYERALAVDIRFLDIGDRVQRFSSERT